MPRTCKSDLSLEVAAGCPEFLANIPFTVIAQGGMASGTTDALLSPRILFAGDFANNKVIDRDDNFTLGTVASTSGRGSSTMIYIPSSMEVWGVSGLFNYYLNAWSAKTPYAGTLEWNAVGGTAAYLAYQAANNEVLTTYNDTVDIRLIGHNVATKILTTNVIVSAGAVLPVSGIAYSTTEDLVYVAIQDPGGATNRIDIYDNTYTLVDSIPFLTNLPYYLTVSNTSNRLYVWNQNFGSAVWSLRVYDCTDNSLITTLYVAVVDHPFAMMGMDESTGRLYTGHVIGVNATIVILDTITNSEICAISHGATELGTFAAGSGSRIYFTVGGLANIEIYE